ncbi:DNA/RNA non-specific endonuclease [Bacteroidota bacterium]
MRLLLLPILLLVFVQSLAQNSRPEIHCKHFFKGYPYGTPSSNDLIIRDIYALSNNDETKFADWLAYRLTMHEVDGDLEIERKWRKDAWLSDEETLEPKSDYDGSNKAIKTDRGHQAPLASFKGSRFASQANLLSNITPQKAALNQGPWKNLEEAVRNLVRTGKTVHVMTGPLYERQMPSLPNADESHRIPSGYWKIVIALGNGDELETAAFIMDQETGRRETVISKLVTIDEVEKRSGLDFLWELEDAREARVEKTTNSTWAKTVF